MPSPKESKGDVVLSKKSRLGLPIRWVLVLTLLSFCVVPAAVIGALFYRNSLQTVDVLSERIVENVSERVINSMEEHLQQAHFVLNGFIQPYPSPSELDRARSLIQSPEQFEKAAFSMVRISPAVSYVYTGTQKGEFLGVESITHGSAMTTRVGIRQVKDQGRRFYQAAAPGDRSGELPAETANYEPRTRPWYASALESKGRVFSEIFISAAKKELQFSLSQPVYGEDNAALGVYAVNVYLNFLNEMLVSTKISSRGVAFLVDEKGLLVGSSAGDKLYTEVDKKHVRVRPDASTNPSVLAIYPFVNSDFGKNEVDSVKRIQYTKRIGEGDNAMIVALRPFGEKLGLRWSLVVAAPESDFAAGPQQALRESTSVMLGLIALGASLATWIAWRLARRFRKLSEAAALMAQGLVPEPQSQARIQEVRSLSQILHDSATEIAANRQQLLLANEHLEERVEIRTRQLAESREEALQAAKAKAAFLATMSHEIRTPLNGVVGMTTLLADTPLNIEQKDYLHTMRISSDQLLSVINDILDYSKIESGKLDLEAEPLSIQHTIEEACDIGASRAREKGLEVLVDVGEEVPPWVRGDVTRLRQILLNFFNNAVKFTEHGQIVMSAHLKEDFALERQINGRDARGALIEFRVKDSGIGIPVHRQGALFQSFTQVDASTTRKYGGTGLGLAICKRLADLMGGGVGVESEEGKGSTFWFTARMDYADTPEHTDSSLLHMASLEGKKAVLIDDTPLNLRILEKQIKRWGVESVSFERAQQALDWLENHSADVILSDMHMPEMDGLVFTQALAAKSHKTPVILLTSGNMPTGKDAELFAARMLKPYRQSQLFASIARLLATHDAHSSAQHVPAEIENKGQTILVADDNVINLKVAVSMLTKLGYESVTVLNGQLAFEAVSASLTAGGRRFAAVLMDANMPVMDGFDATRHIISAHGIHEAPPIIALTASVLEEDRQRCLDAGMIDFLTKPLRMDELNKSLAKHARALMPSDSSFGNQAKSASSIAPDLGAASAVSTSDLSVNGTQNQALQAPPEPLLMDWSRLEQFKEFDDEELTITREVIGMFLKDAPGRRDDIVASLGTTDPAMLSLRAHALKGAASNVGAKALSAACSQLESDCKNLGWPQDAKAQIEAIDHLANLTILELKNWKP